MTVMRWFMGQVVAEGGSVGLFRADVLIQAEEIARIVGLLDPDEARVVRPEGGLHPVGFLAGEKVRVRSAGGEGNGAPEKFPRPGDAGLILGARSPAAVDIHHERGVTVAKRGGVRGHATSLPPE